MRFITEFSKETINELKYYVYMYSDPETLQPFYVGKGKGNRAFSHLADTTENKKVAKLQQLKEDKKTPIIEILAHGLDEETAFKIETAVIDLIGIENLTNEQRGHRASTYGKIDAATLNARYCVQKLSKEDIDDDVLLIRINQNYRNDLKPHELYDITRGIWVINFERAKSMKYAFAVYDGLIMEVYTIACWLPAGTSYSYRIEKLDELEDGLQKRYEFIGNIAPDKIRDKYVNKNVSDLFKTGNRNPIMYIKHNIE